ncbi:GGDEF domain-containing protein [Qipengyuania sp. DGS5-3]|uniref:GGDEF domain-containing protein n=1 Tax=Qipengyuania sp. DGS5-3 TaxID=3349632 RepID=UPI0036D27D8A
MVNVFAFAGPAHARFAGPAEAISGPSAAVDAAAGASLLSSALAAMLVCGLLIIPLIYDAIFYRILRERFILLHAAMVAAMLGFALTSSSLAPILFAGFPSDIIGRFNIMAFATSTIFALLFAAWFIERRYRSEKMQIWYAGLAIVILILTGLAVISGLAPRLADNTGYLLAFFIPAFALLITVALAIGKGSKVAHWVAFGLCGTLAAGGVVLLQYFGMIEPHIGPNGLVLLSVVTLAVATSMGAGDRFLDIRRDRDQALLRATRMGKMAKTDGLTGLLNRRAFEKLEYLGVGQGLLVADIDRFKPINDTYGHQTGDAVLRHTANVLREAMVLHEDAEIYRLGGEEFAILCKSERASQLMTTAEEVREMIASEILELGDETMPPYTISIGAVIGRGQEMDQAFAEADSALYGAKAMGRDRSVLFRYNAPKDDGLRNDGPKRPGAEDVDRGERSGIPGRMSDLDDPKAV